MRARPSAFAGLMLRIGVVEIFADDRGLDDDIPIVHERRHHSIRIELQIFGPLLIAGAKIQMMAFPRKLFFRESKAHLLRANRLSL